MFLHFPPGKSEHKWYLCAHWAVLYIQGAIPPSAIQSQRAPQIQLLNKLQSWAVWCYGSEWTWAFRKSDFVFLAQSLSRPCIRLLTFPRPCFLLADNNIYAEELLLRIKWDDICKGAYCTNGCSINASFLLPWRARWWVVKSMDCESEWFGFESCPAICFLTNPGHHFTFSQV